jgi:hypothetical protein
MALTTTATPCARWAGSTRPPRLQDTAASYGEAGDEHRARIALGKLDAARAGQDSVGGS